MKKYSMQLIFGLPILLFSLLMIYLDSAKIISVEKFGYAFFGGIISHFLYYFFRKSPPVDNPNRVNGGSK